LEYLPVICCQALPVVVFRFFRRELSLPKGTTEVWSIRRVRRGDPWTTGIYWFRIEPMEPGRKTRLRVLRGHDEDNQGCSAVLAMVRIVRSFTEATTRVARQHDLNLPRLEVLLCLSDGEGISQQELSERLLVTKGNVCMTLQAMEAEGLVERRTDAADQRAHRLYLTNAGRQRLAKTKPARDALMARTLGFLSAEEVRTLRKLLGRIEQSFDDMSND
jgi:DNA-binding MarR family transcriptional regulator